MTAQIFAGLKGEQRNNFMSLLKSSDAYMDIVTEFICTYFKLTPEEIKQSDRKREHVLARQISMFIIRRDKPILSLKIVGKYFANRHYSTVIYGVTCVQDQLDVSILFREQFKLIDKKLQLYITGALSLTDAIAA